MKTLPTRSIEQSREVIMEMCDFLANGTIDFNTKAQFFVVRASAVICTHQGSLETLANHMIAIQMHSANFAGLNWVRSILNNDKLFLYGLCEAALNGLAPGMVRSDILTKQGAIPNMSVNQQEALIQTYMRHLGVKIISRESLQTTPGVPPVLIIEQINVLRGRITLLCDMYQHETSSTEDCQSLRTIMKRIYDIVSVDHLTTIRSMMEDVTQHKIPFPNHNAVIKLLSVHTPDTSSDQLNWVRAKPASDRPRRERMNYQGIEFSDNKSPVISPMFCRVQEIPSYTKCIFEYKLDRNMVDEIRINFTDIGDVNVTDRRIGLKQELKRNIVPYRSNNVVFVFHMRDANGWFYFKRTPPKYTNNKF